LNSLHTSPSLYVGKQALKNYEFRSSLPTQIRGLNASTVFSLFPELLDNSISSSTFSPVFLSKIYVDPKGERTTVSIRATIANTIRHFSVLKNTKDPFSIRDWVLSTQNLDEWLFIACQTTQRRSLNPLMSVWFSVALNAIKERNPEEVKQKIWFIIDELHALQKLEHLEESLAELRKYGGCIVLATQNVSQLDKNIPPWAMTNLDPSTLKIFVLY